MVATLSGDVFQHVLFLFLLLLFGLSLLLNYVVVSRGSPSVVATVPKLLEHDCTAR